jgi:predicted helicase
MGRMIDFYNEQVRQYEDTCKNSENEKKPSVEEFIDNDPKKISWSRGLKNDLGRFINREYKLSSLVSGMYRPFCKQWVYSICHFIFIDYIVKEKI